VTTRPIVGVTTLSPIKAARYKFAKIESDEQHQAVEYRASTTEPK